MRRNKKNKLILWINGILLCFVVILSVLVIKKQGKTSTEPVLNPTAANSVLSTIQGETITETESTMETPKTTDKVSATEPKETTEKESTKELTEVTEIEGAKEPSETTEKESTKEPSETTEKESAKEPSETTEKEITKEPSEITEKESTKEPPETAPAAGTKEPGNSQAAGKESDYKSFDNKKEAWCFQRKEDHIPSGTYEPFDITPYKAYYLNKNVSDDDKVIYFAFDCGYEYGYTPKILDVLKENDVKAMFFVTKDFLKTSLDLAIRMKEEGHMVGNHSVTHPSFPTKSAGQIKDEILGCQEYFEEKAGYEMDRFLRPPMGEYSERSLKVTQDLGYTSIFWSMAYFDYDVDDQPGKDYVIDHFKKYYHNGAITLIHTISKSNTDALDKVIKNLKKEGYRFGSLDELN